MKTVKGLMKELVKLADNEVSNLKGSYKLTEKDLYTIGAVLATLQNELGETDTINVYKKLNLEPWEG